MRVLPSFLLLFVLPLSVTCVGFLKLIEVTKSTLELVGTVSGVWEIVNDYGQFVKTPLDEQERLLFSKIDYVNMQLEELGEKIGGLQHDVRALRITMRKLPNTFQYQLFLENLRDYQIFIDSHYDNMRKYVRDIEDYENLTLLDFSNSVILQSESSVVSLNRKMYDIVLNSNFLELLFQQLEEDNGNSLCLVESPQQIFYNILQKTLLANSKSYIMTQFAYLVKKMYAQGNFTKEAKDATEEFKTHTDNIIERIKVYMSKASRELWKCDPERHIPNKTFTQITNLVQGYILNVVNLDKKGKCYDSCETFTYTETSNCRDNEWCKNQQRCPKIINCKLIDDEMTVCKAKPETGKRYHYVEHNSGRVFGKKSTCRNQDTFHLEGYREWIIYKCQYCFCLCDGGIGPYSDRYINLRAAIADIVNNRVVTGLRFVKHNRIIHLQIQEGKLLPEGQIDVDTVRWVPPENYKIIDRYIYEGQDYHTLTWEKRSLELTTIKAPNGSVVTGIRFRRVGSRIDLEVLTTPFDFASGKLLDPRRRSVYQDTPNLNFRHKFGREVVLNKPDISTRSTSFSIPDRATDKFVRFVNTDYDKDAAQTTVPYFDAQPVQSLVPVPLSVVGIYHKGQSGFGGFIAPKIYTYDFSQHLEPLFRT